MSLTGHFVKAVTVRIAVMGAGFGISVLLARQIGAEEFGHYVFALSVVTMLAIPVQSGLPELIVKSLPKYHVAGDWARLLGLLAFVLLVTTLFATIAILTYLVFDAWVLRQFGAYAGQETMYLAVLLLPFIALSTSVGAAIRALGKLLIGQVIETGLRQFMFLGLLLSVALGAVGWSLSAETAMALHIAAAILTTAAGATFLLLFVGASSKRIAPLVEWRKWLSTLVPLSLIAGLQIILNKTDMVMLRALIGAEEVAIYFVANQIGNLVFLANQAVRMVKGPMLSRAVQEKNLEKLQYVYSRSALFVFLCALPFSLFLLLFGGSILDVAFGVEYRSAYPVVIVFAIGYTVQALFGTPELLLKVTDNEWIVLRAVLLGILGNVGLNALLIPPFGAVGAALASFTITILFKWHLSREIGRKLGISAFAFVRSRRSLERD